MFGPWIRAKREAIGITQREAADRAEVTIRSWSAWESDERMPNARYLPAIAAALEVPPEAVALATVRGES